MLRTTVTQCPDCRRTGPADGAGRRCETWGCPGRMAETLFPEPAATAGPADGQLLGWASGRRWDHQPDAHLFDTSAYVSADGQGS